jgi:hypothetical protein
MRLRATALTTMVFVLASGCGGRLGAGSVDAARAACLEAARKEGRSAYRDLRREITRRGAFRDVRAQPGHARLLYDDVHLRQEHRSRDQVRRDARHPGADAAVLVQVAPPGTAGPEPL